MLERFTITGADDSISFQSLLDLSKTYPYVEWGILISSSKQGQPRFPSQPWLDNLQEAARQTEINLSLHICGDLAYNLIHGKVGSLEAIPSIIEVCQRTQINLNNTQYKGATASRETVFNLMHLPVEQIIYQASENAHNYFSVARKQGLQVACLFDGSGGRGMLPSTWLEPLDIYCGYAGGLNNDNLATNLDKISKVVGDRAYWADLETGVRTNSNLVRETEINIVETFDLNKVVRCLETARFYINE